MPSYLIFDIRMSELSDPDLQESRPTSEQMVFITGQWYVPMCVHVIEAGAVHFLPKPSGNQAPAMRD
jgi:FixJ family two-component response regulator